jgi:hypothetical protein
VETLVGCESSRAPTEQAVIPKEIKPVLPGNLSFPIFLTNVSVHSATSHRLRSLPHTYRLSIPPFLCERSATRKPLLRYNSLQHAPSGASQRPSQSSKESDKSPTPASTSCTTSSRHASSHICPNAALRQQQTCIQSRSCCLLVTPAAAAPAPCCPPEHDLAISMEELPSPLDSRSRSSLAADAAAAAAAAA